MIIQRWFWYLAIMWLVPLSNSSTGGRRAFSRVHWSTGRLCTGILVPRPCSLMESRRPSVLTSSLNKSWGKQQCLWWPVSRWWYAHLSVYPAHLLGKFTHWTGLRDLWWLQEQAGVCLKTLSVWILVHEHTKANKSSKTNVEHLFLKPTQFEY